MASNKTGNQQHKIASRRPR